MQTSDPGDSTEQELNADDDATLSGSPTSVPEVPTSRRGVLRLLAGSVFLAGTVVPQNSGRAAAAGTQTADDEQLPEGVEKIVQFVHPQKVYGYLAGLDEDLLAALYGLDVETYRKLTGRFDANARDAARELLADQSFARRIHRLPFRPNDTVVAIGESVTDDLQSWIEILRHLLDLDRPTDRIEVSNRGIEGSTTTDVLGRFVQLVEQQPDWIICCLGAADAVRYGKEPTKTAVSLEETAKNLAEMRRLAASQSDARWVWITPPTVNEELASAFPPFQQIQMTLRNDDLLAIGDILRRQSDQGIDIDPVRESDPVVDLHTRFGQPAPPELVLSDGIHPSLSGQRAIARVLVECLSARSYGTTHREERG